MCAASDLDTQIHYVLTLLLKPCNSPPACVKQGTGTAGAFYVSCYANMTHTLKTPNNKLTTS